MSRRLGFYMLLTIAAIVVVFDIISFSVVITSLTRLQNGSELLGSGLLNLLIFTAIANGLLIAFCLMYLTLKLAKKIV